MKLRLFLPADDRPDDNTPLAWLLLDARGEAMRAGTSSVADIPRAEETELILPASRVLFARLRLPRVNAATIRELLPFAVEDRLLADPSHIHAVAGATNARGETLVAVVDRDWIESVIRVLAMHDIRPRSAWCESVLLAGGHEDWNAVLRDGQGFLVDDEGVAVAFDRPAGGELPLALRVAIDEGGERGARPNGVRLHTDADVRLPDLARWSEQAGVAFTAGTQWGSIVANPVPRGSIDVLRDLPLPGGSRGAARRIPRAAVALVALMALLQLAFTGADAWRLQRTRDALAARQDEVFRAAFPDAKVIVDPALQLSRNLADLKRTRGLAAEDDFLAQATKAARDFPSGSARALTYANGRLEVKRGETVAEAKP